MSSGPFNSGDNTALHTNIYAHYNLAWSHKYTLQTTVFTLMYLIISTSIAIFIQVQNKLS